MTEMWDVQRKALGEFIRTQRNMAKLSQRRLSELTNISNAYLSQIERGLHEPSVRVLKSIADALNLSAETLLAQAGLRDDKARQANATEDAIRADPDLTEAQKEALISVYRSYLASAREAAAD